MQARAVWFENMGACRYREVVCSEIASLYTGITGGNWEVRKGKRVVMDLVVRYFGS